MSSKKIIVANWKMERPLREAQQWLQGHLQELNELAHHAQLIICPDFCSLLSAHTIVSKTQLLLGAQNCSMYEQGAYTGQVSVHSLKEAGASYCIIGHSEQRALGDTDEHVAKKAQLLLQKDITPIVCIGESAEEKGQGRTYLRLTDQLSSLIKISPTATPIIIGYEPRWAIGAAQAATVADIQKAHDHITAFFINNELLVPPIIYGGSIDSETAAAIANDTQVDGFLIGRASLDFQKLKKIVLSVTGESYQSGV